MTDNIDKIIASGTSVTNDADNDKILLATISGLQTTVDNLNATIRDLRKTIEHLTDKTDKQTDELSRLNDEIKKRDQLITELMAQINRNSKNSSKPSSTDGYRKPSPKASSVNRGSHGKKQNGGQPGHEGTTMKVSSNPDERINVIPNSCLCCPHASECEALRNSSTLQTRDQIHLQIHMLHRQYCQKEVVCPLNKEVMRGEFPEDVSAPFTYSSSVKAFVTALSTFGMVSFSRIKELMSGLGVSMSEGTIANILHSVGELSSRKREELKSYLLNQPVIHVDETGMREKGKLHWVHTASTDRVTCLMTSSKRGKKGMDEIGFLPAYHGIAVHDRLQAYFDEGFDFENAVCNAHIDRDLQGIKENYHQRWPVRMQKLLKDMLHDVNAAKKAGLARLEDSDIDEFSKRYDDIIEAGLKRNPFKMIQTPGKRGRKKRHPARNLLESLKAHKDAVLRFIKDFRIPFSNNIAERSFRMAKVKNKVAGTFRKEGGIDDFIATYSIIDTCRKNGLNAFSTLIDLIEGRDILSFLNA